MANFATFPQIQNALRSYDFFISGESDPISTGVSAKLGSLYLKTSSPQAVYQKIGALNTDWVNLSVGGNPSSRLIWLVEGESYANLQEAHDAASDFDTILIGPGSWGPCVVTKSLNFYGLQGALGLSCQIGKIDYNPLAGDQTTNRLTFQNLYITNPLNDYTIEFQGFPKNITFQGCVITKENGSGGSPVIQESSGNDSIFMYNCFVTSSDPANVNLVTTGSEIFAFDSRFFANQTALSITNGNSQFYSCQIVSNSNVDTVVMSGAGYNVVFNQCGIVNDGATGNGIFVDGATLQVILVNSGIILNTSTGYCARGSGTILYGNIIMIPGQNDFQNTLTLVAFDTTPNPIP